MTQLRRHVTDVPYEVIKWFQEHDRTSRGEARELARAELTARRDGYVIKWADPWVCQLLDVDDDTKLLESSDDVFLDGTPLTDPRAREVEQRLARKAGLKPPGLPGAGYISRCGGDRIIQWDWDGYTISWEHICVCQLFGPDGTLIDESGGWNRDMAAKPYARVIAADLALRAGV
jgi:hypothetical protein